MSMEVCSGAMLQCSFGVAPSSLVVLPQNRVLTQTPVATIMDNVPLVNIPTFGMCMSIANPSVAAATSAALGVFTPMPCIPVIPAPWAPGVPNVLIASIPVIDNNCKLMCAWAGVIQIVTPGQFTVQVP